MNSQELSAVIETVSFFLVGIDLYGTERLGKAQARILGFSEKLAEKVNTFREFDWKDKRASKFMWIVYIVTAILTICIPLISLLKEEVTKIPSVSEIILMAIIAVFFYLIMLLIVLVVLSLLILLIIFMTELFSKGTQLVIRIFRSYHLEGVFLFIGTILFLVSKYVQLYVP